jgi:hypothetical protein
MDRQQVESAVRDLGARLGLPDLALDEEATTLVLSGDILVTLGHNAGAGTIELMACLDTVALSVPVMIEALSANFAWQGAQGANFAIVPGSESLVLRAHSTAEQAAGDGLLHALDALVTAAKTWSERLAPSALASNAPLTEQDTDKSGWVRG